MKRLLLFLVFAMSCSHSVRVQAQTASPVPFVKSQWLDSSGNPLALGKLYFYDVGTVTPAATYTNYLQAGTNANPLVLDAAGRGNVFLGPKCYKIVAQNSASVEQWTVDGVCDLALLQTLNFATKLDDKICHASQYTGTSPNDMSGKIAACVAVLPSTGGTIDARGLEGAQVWSTDPFVATSKPITLLLGDTTITTSVTTVMGANSSILGQGRSTKISSASAGSPTTELIRMNNHQGQLKDIWFHGSGVIAGVQDGRRAIWMGCGYPSYATCNVDNMRLENLTIDNFVGHGVSGDFTNSTILNSNMFTNGNAHVHLQPYSIRNYLSGNYFTASSFSGVDINGSYNTLVGNYALTNGSGSPDQASWSGFFIAPVAGIAGTGSNNVLKGNVAATNTGCGIRVYGAAVSTPWKEPFGNIIDGNITYNHTVAYTNTVPTQTEWSGGICGLAGDGNKYVNNYSFGNVFNYVFTGFVNTAATLAVNISNNISRGAVTNAALTGAGLPAGVGFFFTAATRIDGAGTSYQINNAVLHGNTDYGSVAEGFRWSTDNAGGSPSWPGWDIKGNRSIAAGTYGFRNVNAATLNPVLYSADNSNYATGAATANYQNFPYYEYTTVSQATDKTTGVTQTGPIQGRIALCTDAGCGVSANNTIAGGATFTFNITNTMFTTTRSRPWATLEGTNSASYTVSAIDGGANTISVRIRNNTAGALDDPLIVQYGFDKR